MEVMLASKWRAWAEMCAGLMPSGTGCIDVCCEGSVSGRGRLRAVRWKGLPGLGRWRRVEGGESDDDGAQWVWMMSMAMRRGWCVERARCGSETVLFCLALS